MEKPIRSSKTAQSSAPAPAGRAPTFKTAERLAPACLATARPDSICILSPAPQVDRRRDGAADDALSFDPRPPAPPHPSEDVDSGLRLRQARRAVYGIRTSECVAPRLQERHVAFHSSDPPAARRPRAETPDRGGLAVRSLHPRRPQRSRGPPTEPCESPQRMQQQASKQAPC